jgi:hypothetical protein
VKVPVIREDADRRDHSPIIEPTRRLSGAIATLNRPKRDDDTDGDWQTVTTDLPAVHPNFKAGRLFNGTGSSLADVSDISGPHFCRYDHGSTDRIIQHPFADATPGIFALRNDKHTNRPVMIPKLPNHGPPGFLQDSARNVPAPQSRTTAAIRLFSNTFRRNSAQESSPRVIEMETFGHSYESLSSEQGPNEHRILETGTSHWKSPKFRWSRVQQSLGREPPNSPPAILDGPLYSPGLLETDSSHVPHDEFLGEIPRLPFPLISLPEAAMLQHFRRERGEEDHTEAAGSFTAKSRSGTASTVSSSHFPWTPNSLDFGRHSASSTCGPRAPPHIYHAPRLHEVRGSNTSKYPNLLFIQNLLTNYQSTLTIQSSRCLRAFLTRLLRNLGSTFPESLSTEVVLTTAGLYSALAAQSSQIEPPKLLRGVGTISRLVT